MWRSRTPEKEKEENVWIRNNIYGEGKYFYAEKEKKEKKENTRGRSVSDGSDKESDCIQAVEGKRQGLPRNAKCAVLCYLNSKLRKTTKYHLPTLITDPSTQTRTETTTIC